jgi:hypothetical protein
MGSEFSPPGWFRPTPTDTKRPPIGTYPPGFRWAVLYVRLQSAGNSRRTGTNSICTEIPVIQASVINE